MLSILVWAFNFSPSEGNRVLSTWTWIRYIHPGTYVNDTLFAIFLYIYIYILLTLWSFCKPGGELCAPSPFCL